MHVIRFRTVLVFVVFIALAARVSSVIYPNIIYAFFFNDTAASELYTLSLHDALPILPHRADCGLGQRHLWQPGYLQAQTRQEAMSFCVGLSPSAALGPGFSQIRTMKNEGLRTALWRRYR